MQKQKRKQNKLTKFITNYYKDLWKAGERAAKKDIEHTKGETAYNQAVKDIKKEKHAFPFGD